MARHQILQGLLDDKTIGGQGRRILEKLQRAGYTSSLEKGGLSLTGWEARESLFQPGMQDGLPMEHVHFHVTDSRRYNIVYQDEDMVYATLNCTRKTLQIGCWMAWFSIWREEAYRLRGIIHAYKLRGHTLNAPPSHEMNVHAEVAACKTDEEILGVVRRFLNADTVDQYLKIFDGLEDAQAP